MELSIANNRTCAAIPGYQLCLDYQLPAIQQIFTLFLKKYLQISDYNNCHVSNTPNGIFRISCSRDPYHVRAEETLMPGDPKLVIILESDGTSDFERLECEKNSCKASNYRGPGYYFFNHYPGASCIERYSSITSNQGAVNVVPCDGEGILFDQFYLKQSTISLGAPLPVAPPNVPNAQIGSTPPLSGNSPSPTATSFTNHTGFGSAGNATSQNQISFPSLQTGLGAASMMLLAYKERQKMGGREFEKQRGSSAQGWNTRSSGISSLDPKSIWLEGFGIRWGSSRRGSFYHLLNQGMKIRGCVHGHNDH